MARELVLGGVAVLALTAGAWWFMAGSSDDGDETPAQTRPHDGGQRNRGGPDGDNLEARVGLLEDEVASLRKELAKLRMVRSSAVARGAALDTDGPDVEAESPEFAGVVRDIIETEREEAREKRTDAMRERFSERHDDILDELVAVAGLGKTERESIEALWETESEQVIPLFMSAREGDRPFSEVREEAEKLRAATDASVEEMLTPEQYEQYEQMRPGPPQRGRRRREPPP